ncbi:MAG: hypothetical protein IH586_04995 [Anaerolineaceae bacterium]|nr:hypothetical protein [Anaerolineaceae bacterium]
MYQPDAQIPHFFGEFTLALFFIGEVGQRLALSTHQAEQSLTSAYLLAATAEELIIYYLPGLGE